MIDERRDYLDGPSVDNDRMTSVNISPSKIKKISLEDALSATLETFGKSIIDLPVDEKLMKFANSINSLRKDVRLGGVIGAYLTLRYIEESE